MSKVAILGATGPTGIHLVTALQNKHIPVRVVARDQAKLERLFPGAAVEKVAADALEAGATLRAIDSCDPVYDCIGLPGDQMHLHPATARNIAQALRQTSARCVHVSSYWSYYPQDRARMNEQHPREGGPPWIQFRREAENILLDAGAAILHLPDFYGPQVHVSTLQGALQEAAAGKTMNWLGDDNTAREYIYVPDAMRIAAAVGQRAEAFGAHWCLPGAGPLSGRQLVGIVSCHLRRPVKLRAAGMAMLRVVSLFKKDLRGFLQVAPNYMKPVSYDARKLELLLGPQEMTANEIGIAKTLDWIAAQAR